MLLFSDYYQESGFDIWLRGFWQPHDCFNEQILKRELGISIGVC